MFDWVKDDLKYFGNYSDTNDAINEISSETLDIAFIGSGLSSTFTLIEFINQIDNSFSETSKMVPGSVLKIIMFEKDSWIWGGIPYGRRSGFTSLLITPLDEFLPKDELELFVKWMGENIDWLIVPFKQKAGPRSKKWLMESEEKIRNCKSSKIHVPRYFFGIYVWNKLKDAVTKSKINIKLDFINSEVSSIKIDEICSENIFKISIDNDITFSSHQVLLGIGIPEIRSLASEDKKENNITFFNNPYKPDLESTIKQIDSHIANNNSLKILIVGANASALELIYQITNIDNFANNNDTNLFVMSPQGKLPDLFIRDKKTKFNAKKLQSLSDSDNLISADMILNALKEDLHFAEENNYQISDTLPIFTSHVGNLVKRLSKKEKYNFISYHGVEIGRLQRRAGLEYTQPIQELLVSGKLEIIKGKFNHFVNNNEGKTLVEYENSSNVLKQNHFDIVINCAGSQGLIDNGRVAPLLNQLIDSGTCVPTPSSHGLIVGDKFDVMPGFYINGPLLAGNVVGEMGIWHVEHCGRIISFAKQIAINLVEEKKLRLEVNNL